MLETVILLVRERCVALLQAAVDDYRNNCEHTKQEYMTVLMGKGVNYNAPCTACPQPSA